MENELKCVIFISLGAFLLALSPSVAQDYDQVQSSVTWKSSCVDVCWAWKEIGSHAGAMTNAQLSAQILVDSSLP